jgi:predicted dehydrogenase
MAGWGIVGTGLVAVSFAQALRRDPKARLTAVCSRDLTRAEAFAAQAGGAKAYDALSVMLAAPDLDVVYIATPNHLHREQCLAALAAGKAVLCEKPMGISASEAREIAEAARIAGVFCMEGLWTQFIPAVQEAARRVADGAIGTPRLLTASFGVPTHFDPTSRFFDPAQGGGALLDRGCYPISLALRFMGKTLETLEGTIVRASTGVDETAVAILRFPNGGVAQIAASLSVGLTNELVIAGTEGRIQLHNPITRPTRLSFSRSKAVGEPGDPIKGGGGRSKLRDWAQDNPLVSRAHWALANAPKVYPLGGNGYNHEIAEVHRRLEAGETESPIAPLSLTIATLEVIDALRRL